MTLLLLVEGDADARWGARLSLQRAGEATVLEASSWSEALELVRRVVVDAVVLDLATPGIDAPQALSALRSLPDAAAPPIVFLTAGAPPEEIERLRGLGAAAVCAKPIDPGVFAGAVREAIAARPAPAPAAFAQPLTPPAGRAVDPVAVRSLAGLEDDEGEDLAAALVELFESTSRDTLTRLAALAGAPAEGAPEAERLAHSLKGAAATLGATAVAELAGAIEHAARGGRPPDASAVTHLGGIVTEAVAELRALTGTG